MGLIGGFSMPPTNRPGSLSRAQWSRRKRGRPTGFRYRPLLEPLEDRFLPSGSIIDITLSNNLVVEDVIPTTSIGKFAAIDEDHEVVDHASFRLIEGAGDTDNSHFAVDINSLKVVVPLD